MRDIGTCARCSASARYMMNGASLCETHADQQHKMWMEQEDRDQAEEAARLGIEIPPAVLRDREFGPVCWLLSAPFIAAKAWRFVNLKERGVDWEGLLERSKPWSHYERLMVELALNLWNGAVYEGRLDPYHWDGFDRFNWVRVMEALALARGKRVLILDAPEGGGNA